MPTGEILINGGACDIDLDTGAAVTAATCPEIYNPGDAGMASGASSALMAQSPADPGTGLPYSRLYHSLALLLPDGRVFSVGGDDAGVAGALAGKYTGEIFSPPYLGFTPRPVILATSRNEIDFGTTFNVTVDHVDGKPIDAFVLLRPGAVTHHWDADQRYIELQFTSQTIENDQEQFQVIAPPDDQGPPGYYMLFAVRQTSAVAPFGRVPSPAKFIKLK